ncbi:hypothetical protein Agub_g11452 [Astrephomene gubernaculifera]|uniref:Uncharacterized protein n=1 Tax=Astrephomene gubernaculifera TaxID=47775 RepID=A0AAD3HQY9_9CHLO|nr:hypothetical protein Agub_g11452 [Astrephomene gubernaculifera]
MPLVLRHIKGLNGSLLGSVKAIPNASGPYTIAQVCGGAVILGNENNQAPQQLLRGHDDAITAFAMSHGGSLLATGQRGARSDVVLWDVTARAPRFRFQEHDVEVACLAFSHDDRLLMSASCVKDAKLFVLDTGSGKIVSKHNLLPGKRVTAAAWSPVLGGGGRTYTFATAAAEELTLWSLDPFSGQISGQKVVLGSVRREYSSLVFSPDGAWLYCGTGSADVVTVNVQRLSVQMAHPVCSGGVGALLLLPPTAPNAPLTLIAGGRDGSLSTYVPAAAPAGPAAGGAAGGGGTGAGGAWRELRPFATVGGSVTSLTLTSDRGGYLVGTAQGGVYRYDLSSSRMLPLSQAQAAGLTCVSFAPGASEAVAASCVDGSVAVWNVQDYSLEGRVQEGAQAGGALSCVLTRDVIISGWGDGTIRCHSRTAAASSSSSCTPLWVLPGAHCLASSVGVTALGLSASGNVLVSGGQGGELRVWELRCRELAAHMKLHCDRVTDVAVTADEGHVVASSEDRSWSLWDVRGERPRASWRCQAAVRGLAVAPDKVSVATVSLDRKVQMWDVRSPEPRWTKVEAHAVEGGCVAGDNRGATFATGGADAAVKVWDWRTGAEVASGAVHTAPVTKLSYSPDDRTIVSVAMDGSMAFWQLV